MENPSLVDTVAPYIQGSLTFWEGTVVVFDPENSDELLGVGYCRRDVVNVVDDEDETVIYTLKDHPVIVMEESGDIIMGVECWWIPFGDFVTANQQVVLAYGGS